MKKKTVNTTKPVIETILDRKFDELGKRLEQKYITKDDLERTIFKAEVNLRANPGEEITKGFRQVDENAKKYRDEILTKMDEVMGELEIHRIEQDGIKSDIKDLKKHFSN